MGLAKVVFRPDSGDPVKVICGDPNAEPGTPQYKGAVECLWEIFGGEISSKGYRLLNPRVGVIYGDTITLQRAQAILAGLEAKGFASSNLVFGIGSYTYQYLTRDNFGFAMKATAGVVDGETREIFKDPVTDDGTKRSARGILDVVRVGDELTLVQGADLALIGDDNSAYQEVFVDGHSINTQTLQQIRDRVRGK